MSKLPPDVALIQSERERAAIGLYATGHPLRFVTRHASTQSEVYALLACNLPCTIPGQMVAMVGRVLSLKEIRDKNNRTMAFIQMEDATGEFTITAFAIGFATYAALLVKDELLLVRGKISHRPDTFHKKKKEADDEGEGEVEQPGSAVRIELLLDTAERFSID